MRHLKFTIVFLVFNCLPLHSQIKHLVVVDASGLYDSSIKSITPLVDTCKSLLSSFREDSEEFFVVVCNDNYPLFFSSEDKYALQLEKIFDMDPNVPTPVPTIRSVITGLDDLNLSQDSFKLHYFSSLTNLFSPSYNHYNLIVRGLLGILEQDIEGIASESLRIYIAKNDKKINEEYFKKNRKSVQIHLYQ
ncbi:hypothetical protein N9K95_02720 [Schleiferiaceae bacterium]|nr:hypothetical protein [Schleiferiaceae bacterium]